MITKQRVAPLLDRREFLFGSIAASSLAAFGSEPMKPLRFAHRQANMVTAPGQSVFELAKMIPGLAGVELQVIWPGQDLSDAATAKAFKREADARGLAIPSVSGVWKKGETIFQPAVAEAALMNSIRAAEMCAARVILMALFKANCPDMNSADSFEPVVKLLQTMGRRAEDAGVTFGLETSLTPADEKKLLGLVDRRGVRSYYDATNVEDYHPGDGLGGIRLLASRIVQCHLKNQDRLLNEQPAKVNWVEALAAFRAIRYGGWFVFETRHASPERCVTDTEANMRFVTEQMTKSS